MKLFNLRQTIRDRLSIPAPIVLIMVVALVLRIPRVPHVLAGDGLTLVVESMSFLQGNILPWTIHPLSLFGMYAFSGYPVGSVIVMSFSLFLSGGNIELATFLFTTFFVIICSYTSYKLMDYVFDDERLAWIGVAFYTFMPIIYDFTYNTPSSRVLFLAFFPLVVLFLLKSINENSLKNIIEAVIITIIMMLFHRMGIVAFVFIAITIVLILFKRIIQNREMNSTTAMHLNRTFCIIYLISAAGLIVLSVILYGLNPKNLLPPEFRVGIFAIIDPTLIGITIDYFLFYCAELSLAIIGLIFVTMSLWRSNIILDENSSKYILLLAFSLPLLLFLRTPAYSRHLLAPIVAVLAVYGFEKLSTNYNRRYIQAILVVNVSGFLSFILLYSLLWRNIVFFASIMLIGSLTLIILAFLEDWLLGFVNSKSDFRWNRQYLAVLLVSFIVLFAMVNRDMRFSTTIGDLSISSYVTEEELIISNYIRDELLAYPEIPVLLASHRSLAIRIASYAGIDYLSNPHGTQLIVTNFVTPLDAIQNSSFISFANILDLHLYEHDTNSKFIWSTIMRSNYTNDQTQKLLGDLNIRFFVAIKGSYNAEFTSSSFESLFRQTISAPIVFETEHFLVYQLT